MANAAAKKAAAARQSAASTYFPIVVALNLGYLFLRIVYQRSLVTTYHMIVTISLVGLSCISYKGILEDHANTISKGKGNSDALAGGASLDLLGLVVVTQYGTVLISDKLLWLLGVIPIWGLWKIYSIFFASKGGSSDGFMPNDQTGGNDGADDKVAAEKANAKREKRAERRRQKWS